MGVGVEPIVADHDLAPVRDVRDDPGDELQIIHRLQFGRLPAPAIADLALPFIQEETLLQTTGMDLL